MRLRLALAAFFLAFTPLAHAIEIRVSAQALERTLNTQLFNSPDHRFYIKGSANSACYVYASDPKVTFKDDRIWVHIKTRAKLGGNVLGNCVGVGLSPEADVSIIPDAQGESIGFRDPRVEQLSESKELNFLLVPFLSNKLPKQMKINVADLIKQLLAKSAEATGYDMHLDNLKIHSMQVNGDALVVDFDGDLSVK